MVPPSPAPAAPVGTSGGDNLVKVDRYAIKRLEVELEAMSRLARRYTK